MNETKMNHDHLPALKRYTSPKQYEAMQKINETKSMVKLLMDGSWSKTMGALLRSAWIAPHTYTDDAGVVHEGWTVTDAGQHAMKLYELKLAEEKNEQAQRERFKARLYDCTVEWMRAMKVVQAAMDMARHYQRVAEGFNNQTKQIIYLLPAYMTNEALDQARKKVEQEPAINMDMVDEEIMAWREE